MTLDSRTLPLVLGIVLLGLAVWRVLVAVMGWREKERSFRSAVLLLILGAAMTTWGLTLEPWNPPLTPAERCGANLEMVAAALERYANDNSASYPDSLVSLGPVYLKELPLCPVAGKSTYVYLRQDNLYELACQGDHHKLGSANLPSLRTGEALLYRPRAR